MRSSSDSPLPSKTLPIGYSPTVILFTPHIYIDRADKNAALALPSSNNLGCDISSTAVVLDHGVVFNASLGTGSRSQI